MLIIRIIPGVMMNGLVQVMVAYAWPILILIGVFYFRADIRSLLGRLKEIRATGAVFDPQKTQASAPPAVKTDISSLVEVGLSRTPLIANVENNILANISQISEDKKVAYLVRVLAQALIENKFERIYTFIFGSQIGGLRALKTSGGKVPLGEAERFFDAKKAEFGNVYEKSTFSDWFSYVERNDLAKLVDASVEITLTGEDFLRFLDAKGLPPRPF
jgi:hypothetical protein